MIALINSLLMVAGVIVCTLPVGVAIAIVAKFITRSR